jgi:hypothetical protein
MESISFDKAFSDLAKDKVCCTPGKQNSMQPMRTTRIIPAEYCTQWAFTEGTKIGDIKHSILNSGYAVAYQKNTSAGSMSVEDASATVLQNQERTQSGPNHFCEQRKSIRYR